MTGPGERGWSFLSTCLSICSFWDSWSTLYFPRAYIRRPGFGVEKDERTAGGLIFRHSLVMRVGMCSILVGIIGKC